MDFKLSELICVSPLIWLFVMSLVPIAVKAFRGGREMAPFQSLIWCMFGLLGAAGLTMSVVNSYWLMSGLNFLELFS